jgi:two-component system CheB/CheR fusion protein
LQSAMGKVDHHSWMGGVVAKKPSRSSNGAKRQTRHESLKARRPPFPVAGVGASAGGLEAFTRLLRTLPDNTGMAFVFVQHLDPKHVSMLTGLLARETAMPTREVKDGVRIEPDHVYVIPRNKAMVMENGALRISPRTADASQHLPIDVFFRSLAREKKNLAIGVVLSGNGSDGAQGLKAIRAEGGITFAQDEESAKFTGMPHSAVATGVVDFVLAPEEIGGELGRIGTHPYIAPATSLDGGEAAPDDGDGSFAGILGLLRSASHVDFSHYKETTTRRRVMRRMLLHKAESLKEYYVFLKQNPAEVESLYEDILIDVTDFFRDPEAFEALKEQLQERLFSAGSPPRTIRAWVPGCSTGEEVYSIAIYLSELLGDRPSAVPVQLFATDISEYALQKARAGIYPGSIAEHVSPERLRRFFVKLEDGYQVNKRVRDCCIFARQNVAQDPPFSRLDLISCRNVLIYLDAVLQKRIMRAFHYALRPSGLLLLGGSESVGVFSNLFHLEDRKHRIYSRKEAAIRGSLDFGAGEYSPVQPETRVKPAAAGELAPPRDADRLILARYSPAGIVIDEDMEVLEFRGDTSAYLKNRPGAASLSLVKLARENIMVELRATIHRARKDQAPVRAENLSVGNGHGRKQFNLEVIPFADSATQQSRFLVLFEEIPAQAILPAKSSKRDTAKTARQEPLRKAQPDQALELLRLRQEVSAKEEYLKAITEEYEATIEELRSANEEILSSNEELQSTNEELETTKEELQSANEEMNTLNDELQHRNNELTRIGNDLNNVLASTHIPILILGGDLRLRRYTPVSEKVLNLRPSDIGRPLRDTGLLLRVDGIEELLGQVLETLSVSETDVRDQNGHWYSLRLRPYRTEDNRIDGVVLALIDIDPLKRSLDEGVRRLALSDEALRAAMSQHEHEELGAAGGHQELAASHAALRTLMGGLITGQEDERRRLSHEIHDEVNQELALLELDVDSLQGNLPASADEIRRRLSGLRDKVAGLSDNLRGLAYRLHPSVLDDLGLKIALQSLCTDFSEREGVGVNFSADGEPGVLPGTISTCLYRIAQEALRNIAQHANARNVAVQLAVSDGEVLLAIQDDGNGFDPDGASRRQGLGRLGMEERAWLAGGRFLLLSKPGQGARIEVRVPLTVRLNY